MTPFWLTLPPVHYWLTLVTFTALLTLSGHLLWPSHGANTGFIAGVMLCAHALLITPRVRKVDLQNRLKPHLEHHTAQFFWHHVLLKKETCALLVQHLQNKTDGLPHLQIHPRLKSTLKEMLELAFQPQVTPEDLQRFLETHPEIQPLFGECHSSPPITQLMLAVDRLICNKSTLKELNLTEAA